MAESIRTSSASSLALGTLESRVGSVEKVMLQMREEMQQMREEMQHMHHEMYGKVAPSLATPAPGNVDDAMEGSDSSTDDDAEMHSRGSSFWDRSSSMVAMREHMDQVVYKWNKSAWDAALFLGHGTIGRLGSAWIAVGVACNLLLQIVFCDTLLFGNSMIRSKSAWEKKLNATREWRIYYGHDPDFSEPVTGTSLVSKMCSSKGGSLFMGSDVGKLIADFEHYKHYHSSLFLGWDGSVLTYCVVFLFAFLVCAELRDTVYFAAGLLNLPRTRKTMFGVKDGGPFISSISPGRLALACIVAIMRLAVCLVLFYCGLAWLASTANLTDLVMNTVKLAFIFSTDEIVFSAFASPRLERFIERMHPLPAASSPFFRRSVKPMATVAVVIATVLITRFQTSFFDTHRNSVYEELCGGERDFVFRISSAGALVYARTRPAGWALGEQMVQARVDTITGMIKNNTFPENSMWLLQDVQEIGHQTVSELSSGRATCEDNDENFTLAARLTTGSSDVLTCKEAQPYCQVLPSHGARLYCPQTCGCASPASGLALLQSKFGCPAACLSSEAYQAHLSQIPCRDSSLEELQASGDWMKYFYGLKSVFKHGLFLSNGSKVSNYFDSIFSDEALAVADCSWIRSVIGTITSSERGVDSDLNFALICRNGLVGFCPEICRCANATAQAEWETENYQLVSDMFHSMCPPSCEDRLVASAP